VCEAPVDSPTSEQVIKTIEKHVLGKPIRYLIQSHHHNDHLAGIRTYVAHDVTIVTTQPNAKLIQAIANTSFAHAPDRQEERQKLPKFEMVSGKKWSIADQSIAVEVYDIGPTLHAKEMLVTYFPGQGIMFQSDMILYKENPHNTPLNGEFAEWLRKSNPRLNVLAGAHGYTMREKEITLFIEGRLPQTFGVSEVK
jgi:flavorubredoxin